MCNFKGQTIALLIGGILIASVPAQETPPADDPPAPKTEMVIDRGYRPKAGDRAEVIAPGLVGLRLYLDLRDYLRAAAVHDNVGIKELTDSGSVKVLSAGTKVLILQTVNVPEYVRRSTSLEGFASGLQQSALTPRPAAEDAPAAEVRVLDGAQKDQALWVALDGIGRKKEQIIPPPRMTLKKAAPKPISAEDRAETLLRMGQALEQAGNTAAALGYYREILAKHPDQPAAKEAGERIKSLRPE